jgi:hypothetical protein
VPYHLGLGPDPPMAVAPERLSDMERVSGARWSDDALMGQKRMLEKSQYPHRLPKEKTLPSITGNEVMCKPRFSFARRPTRRRVAFMVPDRDERTNLHGAMLCLLPRALDPQGLRLQVCQLLEEREIN